MKTTKAKIIIGAVIAALMAVSVCAFAACGSDCTHDNITHVAEVAPSEVEEGNIEYWYCADCGKYFADADATTEITEDDTVLTYIVCVWDGAIGTMADIHTYMYRDGTYYMEVEGMDNYGTGTWSYNDTDGLYLSQMYLPSVSTYLEIAITTSDSGEITINATVPNGVLGPMEISFSFTGYLSDLQGLTITAGA